MTHADETDLRKIHLLAAATELGNLLYRWNVIDLADLVEDRARDGGTPYHHVNRAFGTVLDKPGIGNHMGFYEALTSGMTPADALAAAKKYEEEN